MLLGGSHQWGVQRERPASLFGLETVRRREGSWNPRLGRTI